MAQSKSRSWKEAWTNIAIGYTINFIANLVVFPMLASDCGCEFEAEGITLDYPLSSYEDLQNQYDGLK